MYENNDDSPEVFTDDINIANNVVVEEDIADDITPSALVNNEPCMHVYRLHCLFPKILDLSIRHIVGHLRREILRIDPGKNVMFKKNVSLRNPSLKEHPS